MSSGDLISVEPQELKFPFELKKQISCSLQLSNKTDNYVAFKVKTTNPKKYCVRPNTGVVLPRSTCDVNVTMQAQREVPPDMQCKDKFLLQCVVANPGTTAKDITPEMFNKESGNLVEECKLRVFYVSPPQPPSPVPEEAEEGSSPRAFLSDNGNLNALDFTHVSRASDEPQDKSAEVNSQILRLTEEKKSAIRQNNKLHQELVLGGITCGHFSSPLSATTCCYRSFPVAIPPPYRLSASFLSQAQPATAILLSRPLLPSPCLAVKPPAAVPAGLHSPCAQRPSSTCNALGHPSSSSLSAATCCPYSSSHCCFFPAAIPASCRP